MRAALGFILTLCVAANAQAAPTLEIRARAELQLSAERIGERLTRVRVTASDDVGAALPLARVVLEARAAGQRCGTRAACVTRRDGTCEVRLRDCNAEEIYASFEGSGTIDGAETTVRVRETEGAPSIALHFEGGTTLDLDAPEAHLKVMRRGPASPTAILELTDELGRSIAVREFGPESEIVVALPSPSLGPPGVGSVIAKLVEPGRGEATARVMVIRQRRTELDLRLSNRRERTLLATLRNSAGPIDRSLVTLLCDGARVSDQTTDAAGLARFDLSEDDERHECHAAFHPNVPGRTAARSAVVRIPRRARPFILGALPWLSLAAAGVLMVLMVRRRRAEEAPVAVEPHAAPPTIEHSAQTQLARTLHRVVVHVIAAENDAPLPDATLTIDDEEAIHADAQGRFELDFTGRDRLTITLRASGRAPESLHLRVPHRGEWSDVRVRLETTRMHARRAIEIVARAAARDDDEAASLTLREAESRMKHPHDPAFPEHAEQHVYGREDPSLDEARALVERGRDRAAGSPRRPPET